METSAALRALFAAKQQHRGQLLADWIRTLPPRCLPLQACCSQGGWADDSGVEISVLTHRAFDDGVIGELTVFFAEVVGGCNCDDDPVSYPACGRLRVTLTRADGVCRFEVLDR